MNTLKSFLYTLIATVTLLACSNLPESSNVESELIEITAAQFAGEAMELGEAEVVTFENTVKCTGSIIALPNGMAKINAPVNGIVSKINCYNGQQITSHQPLIEITGNELIDLQKEYAEASANFRRLKTEYVRIKSLYEEKVTSEKDYTIVETDYKTSMAKYNGLKIKVETIGLSPNKIENGEFYKSYSIKSPINGYISSLTANIGSYIDAHTEILEVINPDMFQIQLSVFTDDISNLKKGQSVQFKSTNSNNINQAVLTSIGFVVNGETKSVDCFASINDKNLINPIANQFLEAEIITGTDTVNAIPSSAIIKKESGYYVLVLIEQEKDKLLFNDVEVKIGKQHNGYTEILSENIKGKILTKGVYNINLQ